MGIIDRILSYSSCGINIPKNIPSLFVRVGLIAYHQQTDCFQHNARYYAKDLHWEKGDVRLLIFLREDIFTLVLKNAREPDKILLNNSILTDIKIWVDSKEDYELEYNFYMMYNDTHYDVNTIRMVQTVKESGLFNNKYERKLYFNSILLSNYTLTRTILLISKKNYVHINNKNSIITYNNEIFNNRYIPCNEIRMIDQFNLCVNNGGVTHKYNTFKMLLDDDGNIIIESEDKLIGFSGYIYNVIRKAPFGVGKILSDILYIPLSIIQIIFNFSFSIIMLLMNNWWYGLFLLEILCIYPTLEEKGFISKITTFLKTHILIITFLYHKIMLPVIELIINLLNTIKNMIKWW